MKRGLLLFCVLLSVSVSYAEPVRQGSVNLVAMAQNGADQQGVIAELALEIHPGSERVFQETFPLTQLSTQASLRFAQQIACDAVDVDCSGYDFLWTIKALPGIVGGPSAGSSAALLAAALLLNKSVPDDVAATGTINSGGLIGPVGGLEHKILAASKNGIRTIFIPKYSKNFTINDTSMSAKFLAKATNVTVVEVADLKELLNLTLGVPYVTEERAIRLDERYERIMRDVAEDLCARSEALAREVDPSRVPAAVNMTERARAAINNDSSYAAASFCFRANVDFRIGLYGNLSDVGGEVVALRDRIRMSKSRFSNHSVRTLTDLQTYMAVMERIEEAEDVLDLMKNDSVASLAYAEERFFSAVAWSRFFGGDGPSVILDEKSIKDSCVSKLSEAEERLSYIGSVLPAKLSKTKRELDRARSYMLGGNYIMCLFTAAKAKSEANVLLSLVGIRESDFDEVIDHKILIANNAIAKSLDKGVFPIIAYSYLDYGKNLRLMDRISALLFTEYALELSNLDIYFYSRPKAGRQAIVSREQFDVVAGMALGMIMGGLIAWVVLGRRKTLAGARRHLRGKKR